MNSTIVTKGWLEDFILQQESKGIRLAYDTYENGNGFVVLTKEAYAVTVFNYAGKAYVASKHLFLNGGYKSLLSEGLPLEAIKARLTSERILPLSEENLQKLTFQL